MTLAKWTLPRCRERKRAGCNLLSPQVPGTKQIKGSKMSSLSHGLRYLLMILIGCLL